MRYRDANTTQKGITLALLVGSTVLVALLVNNLATVLSFAGSIGAISISFILPAMFYIHFEKIGCYSWASKLIFVMGLLLLPLCTVLNIIEASGGS